MKKFKPFMKKKADKKAAAPSKTIAPSLEQARKYAPKGKKMGLLQRADKMRDC